MWNRTGSAVTKGQLVMCDIARTQSETTSNIPGAAATDGSGATSCWGNATPVTQAGYEAGFPILVCLDDSVADNTPGRFLAWGQVTISTLADNASTTDADRGDPVSILVSDSAVSAQAAVAGDRIVGSFLADTTASSGPAQVEVFWTGGLPCGGASF